MKILLILTALLIGIYTAWYTWNTVSMDVHYRLTVTLNTPDGEVSGSAVRAIYNIAKKHRLIEFPGTGNPASERGEAVVVDMPNGKQLFALISSSSDQELFYAFPTDKGSTTFEGIQYYNSLPVGSKGNPYIRFWPIMVTFTDPKDPKTVRRVLMVSRCNEKDIAVGKCAADREGKFAITENHLEDYFGQGVSIKSITVEITDDPVTQGVVDRYLPWLGEYKVRKARLNGSTSIAIKTNELADNLGTGAFTTGVDK